MSAQAELKVIARRCAFPVQRRGEAQPYKIVVQPRREQDRLKRDIMEKLSPEDRDALTGREGIELEMPDGSKWWIADETWERALLMTRAVRNEMGNPD